MLVLSRFPEEVIRIGSDITIKILQVKSNGQVRIGISAPLDIPVHREEIAERIDQKRRQQDGRDGRPPR